ncbi:GNAT family N-acetyltransferase [Silvimonas amylolytica]|uniref:GNAT family acetyltransferase n=1 Tax=Silvimonas amylolytica TaxID=449663 RepID=A0ABQ2PHZ3_9NEIS|nr:GNAT family N-acetyltransferase [Silvimonas amylolytica]GGP25001.1 GNAT family acetyltransferase [Silvimonas amylolytica]
MAASTDADRAMIWTIRPATPADATTLAEIYLHTRQQSFVWQSPADFLLTDFAAQTEGEEIWLAQDTQGGIAGFVSIWAPSHFIHMLYVQPAFHGQGIGSALLTHLPGWANRPWQLKCLIHNGRARRFYANHGFIVTSQGQSADGDFVLMVRPSFADD